MRLIQLHWPEGSCIVCWKSGSSRLLRYLVGALWGTCACPAFFTVLRLHLHTVLANKIDLKPHISETDLIRELNLD